MFLTIFLYKGKNIVKDGVPIATVYPDPNAEHDMHPCIPAIIGLKVLEMQKVFRLFMKALWSKLFIKHR